MLVGTPFDPQATTASAATAPVSLDAFLAGIGPRAFRFAEAGLRHREDALDAVQDAMVKLLGYRERPADEWTPLFWSILRSRIIDLQRRRSFRLKFWAPTERADDEGPIDWADPGTGPVDEQQHQQAYQRLVDALRTLPARQREAFTLRVLEDLDVATTAKAMGCSEGSVKTHLSRARDALQKQFEDFL
ncbi:MULTISPECIES: RNA polymerase sigma factor [Xanthomonas]|uniref:RNA polymerase sigma factor n=3 Tax=Xanthomonas phaseoli TaxID=1985254 RepID=A0AB38E1K6_XANCH|nr:MULTISPECIES: RNA polymerase sigma factor [Xanthomonas]MBV6813918.1 RNA polymerase sigma factor [Xanthomonas campestris pv. passiflorae]OQP76477.1 RNA polymerase sigma factor [Xanthomonas phaseoli pv. syngonii LMG 9055]ATS20303.1 RNA polymerase sigma factor [Xanthomonas phaseoli pv. phaseoli]ATS26949.1 RNA polymerase sigma factor [Xanthomonas phaseoli pv. phaseoli]ATS29584.1 RNA polymerase sigma factor [Xanthomonas phaseoli pv. phaseoli]